MMVTDERRALRRGEPAARDITTRTMQNFAGRRLRWPAMLACAMVAALLLGAAGARGQSIEGRINALLQDKQLAGAQVGVHIAEIGPAGPVEIYSHNADLPLGPASCTKLLTTAAAFERYGPKANFQTRLYRMGEDLVLVGCGDPGLGDAKLMVERGEKVTGPFEGWAKELEKKGIRTFRNLWVDDRVFDGQWIHPSWKAKDLLAWYEAPVGGLNFNANCLDWLPKVTREGVTVELIPPTTYVSATIKATRGAKNAVWMWRPENSNRFEMRGTVASSASVPENVTIYDPGMWTGTILADVLRGSGLTMTGAVQRVGQGQVTGEVVAIAETPVVRVIGRANKNSVNMMAEALCKRLGHDTSGQPGTWENGTAAVRAYACGLGLEEKLIHLEDGSGLSAGNKVAARVFTTVLAHVAARPDGAQFIETLAVPGEDGTLERRFRGMGVAKGIHAKTGHISGVSALSGYLEVNRRRFAFSILVNRYQGNVNPWQEQVCNELWKWAGGGK